ADSSDSCVHDVHLLVKHRNGHVIVPWTSPWYVITVTGEGCVRNVFRRQITIAGDRGLQKENTESGNCDLITTLRGRVSRDRNKNNAPAGDTWMIWGFEGRFLVVLVVSDVLRDILIGW